MSGGLAYVVRLEDVGERLLEIGSDHAKCLGCHCFREVVDEAARLLEDAVDGATAASGAGHMTVPSTGGPVGGRLRTLLAEREGSHG